MATTYWNPSQTSSRPAAQGATADGGAAGTTGLPAWGVAAYIATAVAALGAFVAVCAHAVSQPIPRPF